MKAPSVPVLQFDSDELPSLGVVAAALATAHCPQVPEVLSPQVQNTNLRVPDMGIAHPKLPELELNTPAVASAALDAPEFSVLNTPVFNAPAHGFTQVTKPVMGQIPLLQTDPLSISFQPSSAPRSVTLCVPDSCDAKVPLPVTELPRRNVLVYQIHAFDLPGGEVEPPVTPRSEDYILSTEEWNLLLPVMKPVNAGYDSWEILRTPVPHIGDFPPPPEPPEILSGKTETYSPPEIPAPENVRESIAQILQLWKSEHRIS